MSDAESEAYKSDKDFQRKMEVWHEKRKANPELSSSYEKLHKELDLMIQKHRNKEAKILIKLGKIKKEILNAQ